MKYVPAVGVGLEQVSLLPSRKGRQSNVVVVGCAPRRTYRSASPVPPEIEMLRLLAPAGTTNWKRCSEFRAPLRLGTVSVLGGAAGWLTPCTAASASTIPAPQPPLQAPGNGRVVLFNKDSTCAGVSVTFCSSAREKINATAPATCGVAIEVP